MKPNAIKSVIASALCLASLHSQAQNVASLNVELKGQAHPAWSSSKLVQINPDQKLQEIYNRTSQYLRSPNRVQKMGGMDGGGGNALLCQENGKVTAELLDLYEARALGVKLELGGKTEMLDIIDYTLNRLSKVSPLRAAVYSAMARDLLSKDTQWISNKQMPVIDDVNLSTIPQDCLLVQVAVQRPLSQKNLPNAKTYIIDAELFNLLDETSKAALVLHEVLYREARHSNVPNSIFTRELVGLMMSPQILNYNTQKLNKLYEQNDIACFESEDTPTYIHYVVSAFQPKCDFAKSTNFKINNSKSVTFNFKDTSYTLTEKWSGQTGYRISSFLNPSGDQTYGYVPNHVHSVHQTMVELNGLVSFEAQSKTMPLVKTSPIMIKNGSILTQMPFSTGSINLPDDFESLKISPYTSSNINHYISNVVNLAAGNKRTQAFYYVRKMIAAEKITFQDSNLRLENTACDVKLESCPDSVVIDVDTKNNTLELSPEVGDLQVYHLTAASLNVPKKFINKDGWVSVSYVRFDANGKISQYGIKLDPDKSADIKWFKFQ